MKLQVFVSYGSACPHSRALIAGLKEHLGEAYDFVVDDSLLRTGDSVPERIASWLNGCHAAVILLSEAAFDSDWVAREIKVLCARRAGARLPILPIGVAVGDRSTTRKRVKDSYRLAVAGQLGLYDIVCEGIADGEPASVCKLVKLVRDGLPPSPCDARQRAVMYVQQALSRGADEQLREAWTHLGKAVEFHPPDSLAQPLASSLMRARPELAATALCPLTAWPMSTDAVRAIWQRIEPYWLDERIPHDFVEHLRTGTAAATLLLPATESRTVDALRGQVDQLLRGGDQLMWIPVVRPNDAIAIQWLSDAVRQTLEVQFPTLMDDLGVLRRAGMSARRRAVILIGAAEPSAIEDFRRSYPGFLLLIVDRPAPDYPPSVACHRLHPELEAAHEALAIAELRLAHDVLAQAGVNL